MEVSNVLSNYMVSTDTAGANAAPKNKMDTEQFMTILLAQMTHQNPMEPMNNAEMLSQFSQLNSLQELRSIRGSMESVSSANQTTYMMSLLGRTVKAQRADGKIVEGVVEGVIVDADNPQLRIGTDTADLMDVLEVKGE